MCVERVENESAPVSFFCLIDRILPENTHTSGHLLNALNAYLDIFGLTMSPNSHRDLGSGKGKQFEMSDGLPDVDRL